MFNLRRSFFTSLIVFTGAAGLAAGGLPSAGQAASGVKTIAEHAILVEGSTGDVLFAKAENTPMAPSSMSKLMTVYVAFEKLKDGVITLDDEIEVSDQAWRDWRLKGSTMFLKAGDRVSVHDLLMGIIVQSGNDACVVLAEGLAGSEEVFVDWMNDKARELGMENTHMTNTNGWPDENHYMSARDLAILTQKMIVNFPEYYPMFAEKEFTYNDIRQSNRNPILYSMPEADGLKTGHTEAAGFGLVASAKRSDRRLVLVVNGLQSERARARESERLLNYGFRNYDVYHLLEAGKILDQANVWLGDRDQVPLVLQQDVTLSMSRESRRKMKARVIYEGPIAAPIVKGQPIAMLEISSPDMEPVRLPLMAGEDVGKLGGLSRLKAALNYMLIGSSGSGR